MPVHIAITRKIKPGCEKEFQLGLRDFMRESMHREGVLGVHILMPPDDSPEREYGILRTFASQAECDAFYASPEFKAWCERSRNWCETEPEFRNLCGLEAWFRGAGAPPPRWKMAVATILGVYPTALALSYTVTPVVSHWPKFIGVFVFTFAMVCVLTWLVMPFVTRALRPWLHSSGRIAMQGQH